MQFTGFIRIYYFNCAQLVYTSQSVPVPVWSNLKESASDIPIPMK
jgi:hypothetical protein